MGSTSIKRCGYCASHNITHEYQDNEYGKFNRVHNLNEKGGATCTVCNNGNAKKK